MLNSPDLASLSGVLRTLLWLLIGWFIYRSVSTMFRGGKVNRSRNFREDVKQGDVSIDRNTPPSKGMVDDSAEFVDFEEIDETKTDS